MFIKKVTNFFSTKYNCKEFWIATAIIFLIALFFNANFLLSYFVKSPDKVFTGITGVSTIDYSVYYSMIEQVKQGSILTKNLYSTESLTGGLFHPLWIVLGLIARVFDIDTISTFQWSRFLGGIIFLYFLYFLTKQFIKKSWWRLLTLFSFGFAAGWGRWFSAFQKDYYQGNEVLRLLFGVDLWHSEGFVFLTLTHSSLFIVTQIFLILSWWLLVYNKSVFNWMAGLSLLILGFMHPYDIMIFWSVLIVWICLKIIIKKDQLTGWFKRILPVFIATSILSIYYLLILYFDINIGGWFNQNETLPPSFFAVLIGYGWLWLGSIYGLVYLFKNLDKLSEKYYWLIAWFMTLPLLEFAPVAFARRFIQSFGAVIIIMFIIGLSRWWNVYINDKWQRTRYGISYLVFIILIFLTTCITPLFQGIEDIYETQYQARPSYIKNDEMNTARAFLQTEPEAIILANFFLANIIPGVSGRFVYSGHPHQTLNKDKKDKQVQSFYLFKWNKSKQAFLDYNKIDYVVWLQERADEMPTSWEIWYENDTYIIYKIK